MAVGGCCENIGFVGTSHPLLDVQRYDIVLQQLRYRRERLAVRETLDEAYRSRTRQKDEIAVIAAARVEVVTRQKRFEQEAAIIETRADSDDNRLYSGELRGIRELQALQDEIKALRASQVALEDQALEAMLAAEDLTDQLDGLTETLAGTEQQVADLEAELAASTTEIDEELQAAQTDRDQAAGQVGAELLARYERLRPGFAASTAVGFDDSSGCRCPFTMPAVEVDRIRQCPQGSARECEECGRIVIR